MAGLGTLLRKSFTLIIEMHPSLILVPLLLGLGLQKIIEIKDFKMIHNFSLRSFIPVLLALLVVACGSTQEATQQYIVPIPDELAEPNFIEGNHGKFLSPFTSDLVVADWVDKAIDANLGENLGGLIGTHMGRQVLAEVPFIGSTIGKEVGQVIGYEMALDAIGGEDFLRESSDISFDNLQDMAIYLFKFNSTHPSYIPAVKATMALYPALKEVYNESILNAPRW